MLSLPLDDIETAKWSDGLGMPTGLRMLLMERFQEAREQVGVIKQREQFLRERELALLAGIEQQAGSAALFVVPTDNRSKSIVSR